MIPYYKRLLITWGFNFTCVANDTILQEAIDNMGLQFSSFLSLFYVCYVQTQLALCARANKKRKARLRACNSVNLKLGGIIESLLKIVNILRMCPGLGHKMRST